MGRFETCPYKTILLIERIFQKAKVYKSLAIKQTGRRRIPSCL
jgi:hypothetical protein